MIKKTVYFALTSGDVISITEPFPTPPPFFFFAFVIFPLQPPYATRSTLMMMWELREKRLGWDIAQAKALWEEQTTVYRSGGREGSLCSFVASR